MKKILQEVCETTGTEFTDWEFIDGPSTGVGIDYWLRNIETGMEVYANDDQGGLTIEYLE